MSLGATALRQEPAGPAPATSLIRRIGMLLAGTLGAAVVAFATQVLLTRHMAVDDYGRLAALLAVVNVLTPIATLGMGWFWLELFGREGYGALRWQRPAQRLGLAASLVAALPLLAFVQGTTAAGPWAGIALGLLATQVLWGQSLAETTAARLQLEERYGALAGWQIVTPLGRAAVLLGLLAAGSVAIAPLLTGFAAVGLLVAGVSIASLRGMFGGRLRLAGHSLNTTAPVTVVPSTAQALREALPYAFVTFFYLVYSQGIVAFVHHLLGAEAAAQYNVAFLVTAAIYLIPNVTYIKFLASKLLRWWTHDQSLFIAVFHVSLVAHALLGFAIAVAVAAGAALLLPAVFGAPYAGAASVLTVLAIAIPVRFVQHAYGSVLFAKEHVKRKIRSMGAAAAASVGLNLLLIPAFGLVGAAASAVASEALLLLFFMHGVARHVPQIRLTDSLRPARLRDALARLQGLAPTDSSLPCVPR